MKRSKRNQIPLTKKCDPILFWANKNTDLTFANKCILLFTTKTSQKLGTKMTAQTWVTCLVRQNCLTQ